MPDDPTPTPLADLTPTARALLASALPSAPAGGLLRLGVVDGDQAGVIVVDVDEARREMAGSRVVADELVEARRAGPCSRSCNSGRG